MEDIGSLMGAIALWIGLSCGLWWLHRRRLHGRQDRQLDQSRAAIVLTAEAPAIFDAIREPGRGTAHEVKQATHALLKRIQEHGDYFDRANDLRVQLQAALGIDDHPALSEILHLRRDLWAASEILLVEDPQALGPSFAEPGSYDRIRGEAEHLLFKHTGAGAEEDLIDLRLALAQEEARSFADALAEAIRDAREKDRLPSWGEVVAYPLAFFRAIPHLIRTAYAFVQAFFAYSADAARAIRESEAVARGASRLQQARQDWPERLSSGFERASHAARGSGAALRQHYDFLVTAYDFQTKYEDVLRRAPEVTERGRQFIARLELAEKSERLRLTSANATIWMARRLLDRSAHALAALQNAAVWLSETPVGTMAAALLAPVPAKGRETPAFHSYAMALAASGLSEAPRRTMPLALREAKGLGKGKTAVKGKAAAKGKAGAKPAAAPKAKAAKPVAAPAKTAPAAKAKAERPAVKPAAATAQPAPPVKATAQSAPAKAATPPAAPSPAKPDRVTAKAELAAKPPRRPFFALYATKGEPRAKPDAPPAATTKAEPLAPPSKPAATTPAPETPALKPIPMSAEKAVASAPEIRKGKPAKRSRADAPTPPVAPEATVAFPPAAAEPQASPPRAPQPPAPPALPAKPDKAEPVIVEQTAPLTPDPGIEPLPDIAPPLPKPAPSFVLPEEPGHLAPPPKRPSFFARLFGPSKTRAEREAQAEAERLAEALAEAVSAGEIGAPLPDPGGAPTLMAKLSSLEATPEAAYDAPATDLPEQEPESVLADTDAGTDIEPDATEPQDEPGPLTLSILELQAKIGAKPPQIRSFPWLRG
jgi:hypothetical protein